MAVKRWEFNPYQRETADGEYVEFTDYDELLRLKDELQKTLSQLQHLRCVTGETRRSLNELVRKGIAFDASR